MRVVRVVDAQLLSELRGWVENSTPPARLKDDFFIKLVLAQAADIYEATVHDAQAGKSRERLRGVVVALARR